MAKKIVRLTESELHKVIAESVKRIINEAIIDARYPGYVKDKKRLEEIEAFMETIFNKQRNRERISSQELTKQGWMQGERHDLINRIKKLESEHPSWKKEYEGGSNSETSEPMQQPMQNNVNDYFRSLKQHPSVPYLRFDNRKGCYVDQRGREYDEDGKPLYGEGAWQVQAGWNGKSSY